MPVHPIEENDVNDILRGKKLLADTSFVIAAGADDERFHAVAQNFKVTNPRTDFYITVTVRQELLHKIRERLLRKAFATARGAPVQRPNESGRQDMAKWMIANGLRPMVQSKLQNQLEAQWKKMENGFEYYPGSRGGGPMEWDSAVRVMEAECLDASDAMLLNFAKQKQFYGLVTCDADFNPFYSIPDLHIFMPSSLINWRHREIRL